jgi:hypothetical protein
MLIHLASATLFESIDSTANSSTTTVRLGNVVPDADSRSLQSSNGKHGETKDSKQDCSHRLSKSAVGVRHKEKLNRIIFPMMCWFIPKACRLMSHSIF